jgi:hypothetical protein
MTPVEKTKRDNEMLMEGYRLGLEDAARIADGCTKYADMTDGECELVERIAVAIRARAKETK